VNAGRDVNVSLEVWRVPTRRLASVGWRLATDRGRLRRTPGVSFAKLLGTATLPNRPDPTRWAALTVGPAGADVPVLRRWRALATNSCRLELRPLASKGRWSGQEPFQAEPDDAPAGPVLALTRARLRPSRAARFWRASAPVATAVETAEGLLCAFGIGEAPLGWQGTVSLWRSTRDLVEFAYRDPEHRGVIARTPTERWYAEELFARFSVVRTSGELGLIGWERWTA
jgi:hypothetical protein